MSRVDFPANPVVGQIFDDRWEWDGEKWVSLTRQGPPGPPGPQGPPGAPGGIPEAPADGNVYGRQGGQWTPLIDGGTY